TGDVEAGRNRPLIPGDDRRADAAVPLMRHDLDAAVAGGACRCRRAVTRRIVDDEDAVDEAGNAGDRRADERLLVVCRDDDRDRLPFEHYRWRRRMSGSQTSAAIKPSTSPRNAATTTELRRLRAVVLTAAARVSTCGRSISCAWISSCCAWSWSSRMSPICS